MLLFAALGDASIQRREVDDSLLIGIAEGNREAFTELYRLSAGAVYAYALSLLKNTHEAEDAMQDTFLKIRSAAPLYQPMGKPMAWIFTITRNICLMKLRRQRTVFSLDEVEEPSTAEQITDVEDRLVIRKAFRILSDTECQIIFLHAVTGWKHREIAERLRLPLSTVLSKYNRGLKKLKSELEGIL